MTNSYLGPTQHSALLLKAGRSEADFSSNPAKAGLPRPYAAFLRVTCMPALVARVISISRLNLSHFPLIKSETLD